MLVLVCVGRVFQKLNKKGVMEQFVGSDLVLLTLTVGFYCLGSALYSRTKFALLHPSLLGFVAMILYLKLFRYRLRALPSFDRVAQFRTGTFGRGSGLSDVRTTRAYAGTVASDSRVGRRRLRGRSS